MTSAGLNPRDPELRALVDAATPSTVRSVAAFAARAALQRYPVLGAAVAEALAALDAADDAAALSWQMAIADLAEREDALYFDLLESAGGEYSSETIEHFGRARALTAVAAALKPDTQGALDAISEAYTVHDRDSDDFLARVKGMLRNPGYR